MCSSFWKVDCSFPTRQPSLSPTLPNLPSLHRHFSPHTQFVWEGKKKSDEREVVNYPSDFPQKSERASREEQPRRAPRSPPGAPELPREGPAAHPPGTAGAARLAGCEGVSAARYQKASLRFPCHAGSSLECKPLHRMRTGLSRILLEMFRSPPPPPSCLRCQRRA